MRKVYLDAESLDLVLVPTRPEYEFVFIQTEGKCTATIHLKPQSNTKFKVKIYIYAEDTSEVNCVCTLTVPKEIEGVETDIQIRSWPFDRSKIHARPEMFIKNSNVIATHGNAIGTISNSDKYYLYSRGIVYYKELIKQSLLDHA
jgi:Fe-S cluster assembly scaffold protein SufB